MTLRNKSDKCRAESTRHPTLRLRLNNHPQNVQTNQIEEMEVKFNHLAIQVKTFILFKTFKNTFNIRRVGSARKDYFSSSRSKEGKSLITLSWSSILVAPSSLKTSEKCVNPIILICDSSSIISPCWFNRPQICLEFLLVEE